MSAVATVVLPWYGVALGFVIFLAGQAITPLRRFSQTQPQSTGQPSEQSTVRPDKTNRQESDLTTGGSPDDQPSASVVPEKANFRCYRNQERDRIVATLKADSSIVVVGKEGIGKTALTEAVVCKLTEEGFKVVQLQQATPKNMLKQMADQLDLRTETLEGKMLSADDLRSAIKTHLMQLPKDNKALLIIDDAHKCDFRFRDWLKTLKRHDVPMFLTATDPPRTDIFLNVPRIELSPLPEYAIREIMEQIALKRGLNLNPHDLASIQERAGGNPMLAERSMDEEHLGLDVGAGDHGRYFELTPLIMLVGVAFAVMRFMALGTNNSALYILAGSGGVLFMGVSYAMRALPKEDGKIRS